MNTNKMNVFAGNTLERLHNLRTKSEEISAILRSPKARFVPFFQTKPLLTTASKKDGMRQISWLKYDQIQNNISSYNQDEFILLGEKNNEYYFAVEALKENNTLTTAEYYGIREAALYLPHEEAAILAQGKALIEWNANHRFCGSCGSPTISTGGGTKRTCTDHQKKCGKSLYPRTDPVSIMLVTHEDKCLLGRQARWPKGLFSCLAGFIDSAETIEEAVVREVSEEAGVEVDLSSVKYYSSQPWPFLGGQIMIGCHAKAKSDNIVVVDSELEDARWFTKEQAKRGLDGSDPEFKLPPKLAIAHLLIKAWVEGECD
ncbi:NAD+ diphosphatase [Acrasis kona]|uniref:NAD(+) diphosphatase n=1 Tax=Acrasis kona TaxID=1008807 RepID=A0AAW2ZJN7_9EUKA